MATPRSGNFPDTQAVWIGERLGDGAAGLNEVRAFVMTWYREPLVTYSRALGLGVGPRMAPDDLVHGYFASRLADPDYFASWLKSGLRLRHWLKNGLHFFVREEIRRQSAINRVEPSGLNAWEDGVPQADDAAFDKQWAITTLNGASDSARAELTRLGRLGDWDVFWAARARGVSYESLAREHQITVAQARQKVHAVGDRLRNALRDVLVRDGAKPSEVTEDIRRMMEALHGGRDHG